MCCILCNRSLAGTAGIAVSVAGNSDHSVYEAVDIPFKRRILELRSGRSARLEPSSDNAKGGNMVESPPQFDRMTE